MYLHLSFSFHPLLNLFKLNWTKLNAACSSQQAQHVGSYVAGTQHEVSQKLNLCVTTFTMFFFHDVPIPDLNTKHIDLNLKCFVDDQQSATKLTFPFSCWNPCGTSCQDELQRSGLYSEVMATNKGLAVDVQQRGWEAETSDFKMLSNQNESLWINLKEKTGTLRLWGSGAGAVWVWHLRSPKLVALSNGPVQ